MKTHDGERDPSHSFARLRFDGIRRWRHLLEGRNFDPNEISHLFELLNLRESLCENIGFLECRGNFLDVDIAAVHHIVQP